MARIRHIAIASKDPAKAAEFFKSALGWKEVARRGQAPAAAKPGEHPGNNAVTLTENGKTVTWGVEGMSPNYLSRRGWSKNTFKPGDKITLTIRPMRDGSPGGMFVRGILADGKPVTFAATEQ